MIKGSTVGFRVCHVVMSNTRYSSIPVYHMIKRLSRYPSIFVDNPWYQNKLKLLQAVYRTGTSTKYLARTRMYLVCTYYYWYSL